MQKTNLKTKTIGIIGAGNMGEALIGQLGKDFLPLIVSERNIAQKKYIARKYNFNAFKDNISLCKKTDIIILAVKPQDIKAVLLEIRPYVNKKHLLISIAAGIKTSYIEQLLGNSFAVVRAMPNAPALVKSGITCVCGGKYAQSNDLKTAKLVLSYLGEVVEVKEGLFNVVTALSGSGPGFFAYFIDCFIQAAEKQGLDAKTAKTLAIDTLLGTAILLKTTRITPYELMKRVASKKGTTVAGLKVLQNYKVHNIIFRVISNAARRAKELSNSA